MKSHVIKEYTKFPGPFEFDIDKLTPTAKAVIERWNKQPDHLRTMSAAELMNCTENDLNLIRFIMYLKKKEFAPPCPGTGRSFVTYENRQKINRLLAYVYGDNEKKGEIN